MTPKKQDPSYLLGQLVGTAQCLQEAFKMQTDPSDNSLTVAEQYFNDMIEEPRSTLLRLERDLAPLENKFHAALDKEQVMADMMFINKLKDRYELTDEHLDEDEYFKGYQQQVKKFMKD